MTASAPKSVDVVIVGAGFAGLYALYKLRSFGFSAQVFEAGDDVGGVWNWNRYPGARCDVESMEYSYSFSDPLQQEWEWTERYGGQAEILAYLRHVTDRFDLRRDIAFSTRVTAAIFDEQDEMWSVRTDRGDAVRARFCVMASGSLSVPRLPDVPGIDRFTGPIHHTGSWPPEGIDFSGKRVAVIGTGSSGVQSIPKIAEMADHLVVFQRTPSFVIPAHNGTIDPAVVRNWKANYPALRAKAKTVGTMYEFSTQGALDVSSEEREAEYQRRWARGGVNFTHAFNNIYTDEAANKTAADFVRARIREAVKDPCVAERLCPDGYPLGAKRICVGTDYYETYNRDNVTLVDLRETPVIGMDGLVIHTTSGEYGCDMIVCATGYDALTGALMQIDVRGRAGVALCDKWAAGPRNYLGLMTAGFPNFFIVTGPGSPSVLVNMVIGIEQHVDWIADCLRSLEEQRANIIEPQLPDEDKWVQYVNDEADLTLFSKTESWYNGANIPGKPRVFLPFVGGIARYRNICDDVAANGYRGFRVSGPDQDRFRSNRPESWSASVKTRSAFTSDTG